MDLLNNAYANSSASEDEPNSTLLLPTTRTQKRPKIDSAPDVGIEETAMNKLYPQQTDMTIYHNIPYEDLAKPLTGPHNPFKHPSAINKNIFNGHVEEAVMDDFTFNVQQRSYLSLGYANDPNISMNIGVGGGVNNTIIGNYDKAQEFNGELVSSNLKKRKQDLPKRLPKGDSSVLDGDNAYKGPWAGYDGERIGEPIGMEELEFEVNPTGPAPPITKVIEPGQESTIFHGQYEVDYQGRPWTAVPHDIDINLTKEGAGSQKCFLPKKQIHTWTGHTKAVSAIRFFPTYGHLLLSSGMDGKVKIWDVYHDRRCMRTYLGHNKAVRDITFNNAGDRFLSGGYDKTVKLWDTETGKCITSFNTKSTPYCIKFNPDHDKQNLFLTGCSENKILQFDTRSGKIVQEYDQHLGAVNSITFIDENRRFVSTSDDKSLRVWEFGIPVVIKYIAEPHMHSMPCVAVHPSNKWMACQSLDNQIQIYSTKERVRLHRKKSFQGHLVAGYACQLNFSPDGNFLMSGDSDGSLWFWNWKTSKVLKKMKAHNKVLIDCQWHPQETSKVATCSWDGLIKYWD